MPETLTESDDWRPTPDERKVRARLLDGTECEFTELAPGDIFQAFLVSSGALVNPVDQEEDPEEEGYALCHGRAVPNIGYGCSCDGEGFAVPVETGKLEDLMAKARQMGN